jgi:hypothetical protein
MSDDHAEFAFGARELTEAIREAIDSVPSRDSLLLQTLGPLWRDKIDLFRAGWGGFHPIHAVNLAEVLWHLSQEHHKSAVSLLRLARRHSLGDADVDFVEVRLDERLRREADDA